MASGITNFSGLAGDDDAGGGLSRGVPLGRPFQFTNDGVFDHYINPAAARWEPTDNPVANDWEWVAVALGATNAEAAINGEAILDSTISAANTGMTVQSLDTNGSLGYLGDPLRTIICESSIQSSTFTAPTPNAWFFGLSEVNTSLLTTAGALSATDNFAGFHYPGDRPATLAGRPDFVYGGDTGGAVVVGTLEGNSRVMEADVYTQMGLRVENNAIEWYMDEKLVASVEMAVPFGQAAATDQLFVTLSAMQIGTGGSVRMDYYTIQQRRRPRS